MARDLIDRRTLVEHYDSEEFEGKFVWSKSIVKYIQSLPAEGAWIPCNEKLPEMYEVGELLKKFGVKEMSKPVNITVKSKKGNIVSNGVLIDGKWTGRILNYTDSEDTAYEVVAWMPYPEPYKERR